MASNPLGQAMPAKKKSSKKFLLIGLLGSAALIGSTGSVFAANVSINSGSAISYSQGTTTIAACDTDGITVALGAFYSTANSRFELDTISLTGVSDTCDGKTVTIELYGTISSTVTKLATVVGKIKSGSGVTEVIFGNADAALATGSVVNTAEATKAVESSTPTPTVTYEGSYHAGSLASDANRFVIEIN